MSLGSFNTTFTVVLLAAVLEGSVQKAAAKKTLGRAVSLKPDDSIVQLPQGDYEYYGCRKYEHALVTYQKVVAMEPNIQGLLERPRNPVAAG